MELWFILAVSSAFASGTAAYVGKVAAVNNTNMSVVALYAAALNTVASVFLVYWLELWSALWHPMLFFAFLAASSYFLNTLLRVEALKLIDSAIFFPIYKVLGPLLAIIFGIVFFGEQFTAVEWFGLAVSLMVPLLLINKAEKHRQQNLYRGLLILLLMSVIASVSIAFMKAGSDIALNPWAYVVAGEFFLGLSALVLLAARYRSRALQVVREAGGVRVYTLAIVLGVANLAGAAAVVLAFTNQGPLGIVYTINSLYILIPIVLSIIFYNEHWNLRKVIAIVLSIAALGLLG